MKIPKSNVIKLLSEQMLTLATLASVVLGVGTGLILRASSKWSHREIMYINFIGELFLRMLKGLILPLIVSSLIAAIGTLNLKSSGKIGGRAIAYYMITTFMAVILGIILVMTIRPGADRYEPTLQQSAQQSSTKLRSTTTTDTMLDLIRNMFPPNIIQACLEQFQTILKPSGNDTQSCMYRPVEFDSFEKRQQWRRFYHIFSSILNLADIDAYNIEYMYGNGMNIIGLVVSACVFGIAMSSMHGQVNTLLALVTELSTLMMKVTSWVIFVSPIGIFFLTVSQIIAMDDLNIVAGKLGLYLVTVICGILFHGFIVLPIIFYAFTRKNPYTFIGGMGQAIVTAFGTASR